MKAIILAGGLGTRLRPLTHHTPKALVKIQGKPLTEHILDILKMSGITEIYLSVSYLADKIKDYFGDGSGFGVKIKYIEEKEPLGTAGPLLLLGKNEFNSSFVMINGDILFNIDLKEMLNFHNDKKAVATVALIEVDDPSHYGTVRMEDKRIVEYVEKPKKEEAPSNLVNAGYYIFKPEVLGLVEGKKRAMIEYDISPILAKQGKLFGYPVKGQWFEIGNSEKLEIANKEWKGVGSK